MRRVAGRNRRDKGASSPTTFRMFTVLLKCSLQPPRPQNCAKCTPVLENSGNLEAAWGGVDVGASGWDFNSDSIVRSWVR